MMQLLRRILRSPRPAAFIVLIAGAVCYLVSSPTPVKACWVISEYQCFDVLSLSMTWPWTHPAGTNRQWRRYPAFPPTPPYPGVTWGFERTQVFDTHSCPEDATALWCIGIPNSNDPRYNNYVANIDDYVTYGPINLSTAVAASASFWLFDRTVAPGDSIFWGCSTTYNLNSAATMNMAGSHSALMTGEFELRTIDFSHVVNLASGDTVSMIGQSAVYVFWRFRSDGGASTVDKGAFIDNVTIAWDDGGVDLISNPVSVLDPADSSYVINPQQTDTMMAFFSWRSCSGGAGTYPPFHILGKVYSRFDTLTLVDSVITDVVPGATVNYYSPPWTNQYPDSHWVRFKVDALNEVSETDETNNESEDAFLIPLPYAFTDFHWITPSTEREIAHLTAILRWSATDTSEATLSFSVGSDSGTCVGNLLVNRPAQGLDSISWNTASLPQGRILWPFVHIVNPGWDSCIYAPFPIEINHLDVVERPEGSIPSEYFLAQNFPNPFNPTTEFRYGVAVGGLVTLRVYDLLGRQVAELVNGNRAPGSYIIPFDGTHLTTGTYIYTLTTPEGTQSRKMMLLK